MAPLHPHQILAFARVIFTAVWHLYPKNERERIEWGHRVKKHIWESGVMTDKNKMAIKESY